MGEDERYAGQQYISTLAEEAENNFVAYLRYVGRVPGVSLIESDQAFGLFTGIPGVIYNSIVRSRATSEELTVLIEEAQALGERLAVPVGWWTWPTTRPRRTEQVLTTYGFMPFPETLPWMALKLVALPDAAAMPPGFTIELVQNDETLNEWMQTQHVANGGDWGGQDEGYITFHARHGFNTNGPLLRYLGRMHGEPVGTAMLFLEQGGAGLYSVSVVPEVRRQGIGTALSSVPLLHARALGCQIATLMTSKDGYALYERLGFREVCRTRLYAWQPADADESAEMEQDSQV